MKTSIILLGSRARVGKDTVGTIINRLIGARSLFGASRTLSFAANLRNEISKVFPTLNVHTQDVGLKELIVRPLLIAWGQARRHDDPEYWVNLLAKQIDSEICGRVVGDEDLVVTVTDWRFANELLTLRKIFEGREVVVIPVQVERPGVGYASREEALQSPLCAGMAEHVVYNAGSLEHLEESVGHLLNKVDLLK